MNQMKRVILDGGTHVSVIENALQRLHPNVNETKMRGVLFTILNGIVEAIREESMALANISWLVSKLREEIQHIPRVKILHEIELCDSVKALANDVYRQARSYGLYDDRGLLKFCFYRLEEDGFKDIVLASVLQLTYNGGAYEVNH